MPDQLLQDILERLNVIDKQGDDNAKCLAVLHDRLKHHMEVEHRDFDSLIDVVRQGKTAAKTVSILIAGIAAVASAVAWIVDHLPRLN